MSVKKIVSGGQTGADQAALDYAIEKNIPHGGWLPKGRLTEDGPLPAKYKLQEMPTESYPKRTEQNVIDSDGTLIFSHGKLSGGSALTRDLAIDHQRPWLHLDMSEIPIDEAALMMKSWLSEKRIQILNVAGPKRSKDPGLYDVVVRVLQEALQKE